MISMFGPLKTMGPRNNLDSDGATSVQEFLLMARKAAQMVEEANQITAEVKPGGSLGGPKRSPRQISKQRSDEKESKCFKFGSFCLKLTPRFSSPELFFFSKFLRQTNLRFELCAIAPILALGYGRSCCPELSVRLVRRISTLQAKSRLSTMKARRASLHSSEMLGIEETTKQQQQETNKETTKKTTTNKKTIMKIVLEIGVQVLKRRPFWTKV